jgi:hypothetical protein
MAWQYGGVVELWSVVAATMQVRSLRCIPCPSRFNNSFCPIPSTLFCVRTHNAKAARAIVSSVLMNIAIVGINQVYDKKLDRVSVLHFFILR